MKKLFIIVLAASFLAPALLRAADITGQYSVKGFNPGVQTSGKPSYEGKMDITQSGGAYLLDWKLGPGGKETYKGVGIFADGILAVAFNGGVVSYKVERDQLKGVWAPYKGGQFGYEFCQKR